MSDEIDDSLSVNDFESVKDDPDRSHYVVLSPGRPGMGLYSDVRPRGDDLMDEARDLAHLYRLYAYLQLPRTVLTNMAYIYRLTRRALLAGRTGEFRLGYYLAVLVEAAELSGVYVTDSMWTQAAAYLLGYGPTSLDREAMARVQRLRGTAFKVLKRMRLSGMVRQPRVRAGDSLSGVSDPVAMATARRLYTRLNELLGPTASVKAKRALAVTLGYLRAGGQPDVNALSREANVSRRLVMRGLATLAERLRLVLVMGEGGARPPEGPPGPRLDGIGVARVRCARCGHEWAVTLRAPSPPNAQKLQRLYWAVGELTRMRCPRCGTPLGGVLDVDVEPLEAPDHYPAPEHNGNNDHGDGHGA